MDGTGNVNSASRSPYGERGLKCNRLRTVFVWMKSLSLRRAWIEIIDNDGILRCGLVALLTESVD